MERHNLLFTGGFDSTFRLCQLSRMEGVEVQPVYLCFSPARSNEKNEIHAQDTILSMLRKRKDTKAVLLNPIRVHEYDLPEAPDLDEAFQKWRHYPETPGQIRCISKLSRLFPHLEYCIEGATLETRKQGIKYGKTRRLLTAHGFRFFDHEDGSTSFKCSHADSGLDLLWGGFRFPIFQISETDMLPFIHKYHYEDVFEHTWTCDFGDKEPCGVCHNCETKWASGLPDFFPESAVRNHEIKKYLEYKNDPMFSAKAFTDYVHFGYHCYPSSHISGVSEERKQLIYQLIINPMNQKKQAYFDSLIRDWDEKRCPFIASKNKSECG